MLNAIKEFSKILVLLTMAASVCVFLQDKYKIYKPSPAPLYMIKQVGTTYYIDLGLEIKNDVKGYRKLREWLNQRTDKETVVFEMSNYGGSVQAGFEIINGIALTKAKTIAWVKGPTFSMGTAISCSTKVIIFSPYSFLMFHRAHNGISEYAPNFQEAVFEANKGCISKGILPQDEITKLINITGHEYYYWPTKDKK